MQLTVKQAAAILNVAEKTVYRWIQDQKLPAYRIEGQYRINRALLFEWATAKKVNFSPTLFQENGPEVAIPSLSDGLLNGGIFYRIAGADKASILKATVSLLRLPESTDRDFLYQALLARESLQSTGIGDGIAVPHVRNPLIVEVDKPLVCLCFLEKSVDFQAMDGKPVFVLFTLVTPSVRAHLHLLSRISFCLRDPTFKEILLRQGSRDEILDAARKVEDSLSAPVPAQEPTA